jgi:UDP-N-acetylglucosamine transferase subunit ALG13
MTKKDLIDQKASGIKIEQKTRKEKKKQKKAAKKKVAKEIKALATELNAPIPENKNKATLQELRAEKRYNKLVDDFKQQKAKIFAKRNYKNVINDIKQHQRNRIEITIPVKKTDPPTVDRADIDELIGDINFKNYALSFTVTITKQTLNEFGNLESEKDEESPSEPIKHRDFIKKYEKRTAGALAGFFNNYMKLLTKSLSFVKKINLILTKHVKNPRPLTPNFDGMVINCLINVVSDALKKRKDYQTVLLPKLDTINTKYFKAGVTEEAIDEICSKLKINIHVVSILQETWYHRHTGDTRLTVLVCSHNGHATVFSEEKTLKDFIMNQKDSGKFEYVDMIKQHFLANPSPIKFPIVINDQMVAYYDYDGNLFKNQTIFKDGEDFEQNKENKDLKNIYTLTSRYYADLKKKYNLQDFYNDEDLYHFVRTADQYAPPWCSDPDYAKNGWAFDQDRAYMYYEKSKYYDHYQFPRRPTHFYEVTNQQNQDDLLQLTGFAQVTNTKIPNHLTYLVKTKFIQDNAVYTTMRLAWLKSLGVTFDIVKIAWANDKQKIDFHVSLTEWQQSCGKSAKQEECSLMGRLIPNQDNSFKSLVHCNDENEFLQLRYQLGAKVVDVDFENKIVTFSQDKEKQLKGIAHVHAYILDYQQIEFVTKALSVPFEDILKVKVDCIVLRKPLEKSPKLGDSSRDFHHVAQTRDHPEKNRPIWAISWVGFHEEKDIRNAQTQHIDEADFTHRVYRGTGKLNELPPNAFHRFIEVTGDAGTGKTYSATHWNLYNSCVLVPTNALKVKFKKENPDLDCMTYHKALNILVKKGDWAPERKQYSTYIIDECSMICKGVMNLILTHRYVEGANVVLIHDRAQLAPIVPDNSKWECPEDRYFTNGKEYKKRSWHQIHLTEQRRQNDPNFINILTKMRDLHDRADGGLQQMIELLKDRIITEKKVKDLYRYDTEDLVIASTHEEVTRWNKKLMNKNELKLIYTKTTKNYVNNQRVIQQKEIGVNQELAFASTVHIVQGLTHHARLFISLSLTKKGGNFDNHLMYTSVSRVKTLDNLYLIAV